MKLIGFTGSMGSGKSTAIECLKKVQPYPVINVKFAQPLYDIQEFIYRRIAKVYEIPSNFKKDRKLLQLLGTEWGRDSVSESLWIDLWKHQLTTDHFWLPNAIFTCDDVRFNDEADVISSLGGYVIKLETTNIDNREVELKGISNHASEAGVDLAKVDYIIENSGTVDDLSNSLLTFNSIKALW